MSIFLEAIQRFVEPQVVSNPKLVLIVGCLGLASNIVGLFLFHDHGHSHGGHGHSHADPVNHAEQGHSVLHPADEQAADERGNIADVMPESRIGAWPQSKQSAFTSGPVDSSDSRLNPSSKRHSRQDSRSRSRTFSSVDDVPINPSSFRRSIISAGRMDSIDSDGDQDDTAGDGQVSPGDGHAPSDSLLNHNIGNGYGATSSDYNHKSHKHAQPVSPGGDQGHGHGHGHDLNMRGVFLHVMGDALGNVGVIVTALLIWLTDFEWRYYFDPAISLLITFIILLSAIPLCRAASRILLQAVPAHLSVDDIKADVETLPGIVSCHHLHVWQLSDTKLVASLHVQVAFDFEGEGSARYMRLARAVRDCLHEYGIHSSTIQPEFCLDPRHDHLTDSGAGSTTGNVDGSADSAATGNKLQTPQPTAADSCLLECAEACGKDQGCCSGNSPVKDSSHAGHSH